MLNHESIRDYCLAKTAVTEDFPFDEDVLVFRVKGKIFLLTNVAEQPVAINLKCEPEKALDLRDAYEAVQPGWHMNKKHWNTVTIDGTVPEAEILSWIDHSYDRVVLGLKKADREALRNDG